MSPAAQNSVSGAACFPRVSGDEPGLEIHSVKQLMFSPRERG